MKKKNRTLIYGCMGLGGAWDHNSVTSDDEKKGFEAIETALEIGISVFDHADIYTFGKAEEVFGRFLKQNPGLRDGMRLQTKAGIRIGQGPEGSNIYDASRDYLVGQVEASLRRLHTDHLDVLLLHRPDALMDPQEVAETFESLKHRGLVRDFGVCNMSVPQIRVLQNHWTEGLKANQIQLSLKHCHLLDLGVSVNTDLLGHDSGLQGLVEYAQTHDLDIQAWGALDRGLFTDRNRETLQGSDWETSALVSRLAAEYGTTPTAIVLAWLLRLPFSVQPLIGTTKPERIRASQSALDLNLSREDWYALWITARGRSLL